MHVREKSTTTLTYDERPFYSPTFLICFPINDMLKVTTFPLHLGKYILMYGQLKKNSFEIWVVKVDSGYEHFLYRVPTHRKWGNSRVFQV